MNVLHPRRLLADTALRADDAGDVLTAFIALQWMVPNDTEIEPSPAALRAGRPCRGPPRAPPSPNR